MNKKLIELTRLLVERAQILEEGNVDGFGTFEKEYYQSLRIWSESLVTSSVDDKKDFLSSYRDNKEASSVLNDWNRSVFKFNIGVDMTPREKRLALIQGKRDRRFLRATSELILNSIKETQFTIEKDDSCSCKLRQQLGIVYRSVPYPAIKKIGKYTDGYYEYELFKCDECYTYWVNSLYSDDAPNRGFISFETVHKNKSVDDVMKYVENYNRYN